MASSEARRRALFYLAVLALTLGAYARVPTFDFVRVDDPEYVYENPRVLDGLSLDGAAWAFTTFHKANWHPLTWLSLQLDASLGDGSPTVYHVTNVLLHALAALLLMLFLETATGDLGRSAFVAAVFAIHPLHVESVAWVSERKDVLSAALGFAVLLAWVRYARRPSSRRYGLVVVLYALGLLAKPMLVTWPLLLLLVDAWPLGRARRGSVLLREKAPLLLLAAGSAVVTVLAQSRGGAVQDLVDFPLGTRVANAAVAAVAYLRDFAWPTGLAQPYPYDVASLTPLRVGSCAALLVAATVGSALAARRRPWIAVGWGWYLIALLPVIGIVQVGAQPRADRYTYLPLVGIAILVAWSAPDRIGWRGMPGRPRADGVAALACAIAIALATATWVQTGYWKDSRAMIDRALAVTGNNAVALDRLAAIHLDEGRFGEAAASLERAVAIWPRYFPGWVNLGVARFRLEDFEGAASAAREALAVRPDLEVARRNLAAALESLGSRLVRAERDTEAEAAVREAIALDPESVEARNNLAIVLARTGRIAEAIAQFEEVVRRSPGNEGARRNLERARALSRSGGG